MYLYKTEKARDELASRRRSLPQRERAALLMADGSRTRIELRVLCQCDDAMIDALMASDHLQMGPGPSSGGRAKVAQPAVASSPASAAVSGPAAPAPAMPTGEHSVDNFEGKRSLATTRMFLFDICERMFARRQPEKALWFRDQLREARDRDSMLVVAREMITAIEVVAGHERADSLSERIAMLLPPE